MKDQVRNLMQAPVMTGTPDTLPSVAFSSPNSDSSIGTPSSGVRKVLFGSFDIDSGQKLRSSDKSSAFDPTPHSSQSGLYLNSTQIQKLMSILTSNPPPPPTPSINHIHEELTEVMGNLGPEPSNADRMKIESLELECQTLKEIIQSDSSSILYLKSSLEDLRSSSQPDKKLVQEIEDLKKERAKMLEREKKHLEAMTKLEKEVERLSDELAHDSTNVLEQMKLENELFAAQIVENEVELQTVRSSLNDLEMENLRMLQEVENIRQDSVCQSSKAADSTGSKEEPLVHALVMRIELMEEKLAKLELMSAQNHTEGTQLNEKQVPRLVTINDKQEADNDIEVTLEELIISVDEKRGETSKGSSGAQNSSNWYICDCLPRFQESGEI